MKSGTLFDNVLITDDVEYAKQLAEETWGKHKDVSSFYCLIFGLNYTVRWYDLLNGIVFLQAEKAAFEEAEKKKEEEVKIDTEKQIWYLWNYLEERNFSYSYILICSTGSKGGSSWLWCK